MHRAPINTITASSAPLPFSQSGAGAEWIEDGIESLALNFSDVLEPGADDHPLRAGAVTVEAWQFAEAFHAALTARTDNEFPLVQLLLRARRDLPALAKTIGGREVFALADQVARTLLEAASVAAGERYRERMQEDDADYQQFARSLDDHAA
jgi:hypothetical protein